MDATKEKVLPARQDHSGADLPNFLKSGDGPEKAQDPDPEEDCKCYMQVKSVENFLPGSDGWGLFDVNPDETTDYEIEGNSETTYLVNGIPKPLPSPFSELNPPSNGWHMFYLTIYAPLSMVPDDYAINTVVKCYLQNPDGTETLATTTNHTFLWSDGIDPDSLPGTGLSYASFWKEFSCLYLTVPGKK